MAKREQDPNGVTLEELKEGATLPEEIAEPLDPKELLGAHMPAGTGEEPKTYPEPFSMDGD